MSNNFSDLLALSAAVISVIGLLISFASAYYAKSQRDIAEEAKRQALLGQISASHERYRNLARVIKTRHRGTLLALRDTATEAHSYTIAAFDQFDREPSPNSSDYVRPLRHLIGEASDMLFDAFKGQLGRQTGPNVSWRFYRTTNLEDDLQPATTSFFGNGVIRHFLELFGTRTNSYPETALLSNPNFCRLVVEMRERIPPTLRCDVLRFLLEQLEPVRRQLANAVNRTAESVTEIDDALDDDKLEIFPLEASTALSDRLLSTKAKFETLASLHLFQAEHDTLHHYRNYVSIAIYTCALMRALASLDDWDWER